MQKCNHLTLHLLLHKLSKTLKLHFITNLLLLIEGITRMSQNYLNIDRFIYGGDYNPEQWLDRPDIFKQDLLLMKKAHINTVTLGVFSWSTLEPIKDAKSRYSIDYNYFDIRTCGTHADTDIEDSWKNTGSWYSSCDRKNKTADYRAISIGSNDFTVAWIFAFNYYLSSTCGHI